jgi:hypothetical protein
MIRNLGAGVALAMTVGVGSARADTILYFQDFNNGTDRMAQALVAVGGTHTVTTATSLANFTTLLSGGGYDLAIFFQQIGIDDGAYDAAWAAVAAHIAAGGAAIGADWSMNGLYSAAFATGFTGGFNNDSITVTEADLLPGLASNPIALTNPGWGVYSTGLLVLAGGACAATFSNGQCAIVIGNDDRTKFNGFLDDTFLNGVNGVALYVNEINEVLGAAAVPEPGTLALAALALAGLGVARRRALADWPPRTSNLRRRQRAPAREVLSRRSP